MNKTEKMIKEMLDLRVNHQTLADFKSKLVIVNDAMLGVKGLSDIEFLYIYVNDLDILCAIRESNPESKTMGHTVCIGPYQFYHTLFHVSRNSEYVQGVRVWSLESIKEYCTLLPTSTYDTHIQLIDEYHKTTTNPFSSKETTHG
ncbi:MAG: hypothetical protein GY804_09160 [Alphaproteobacteria bacterium]|nr:hypothetical protein [Alphaproteobacteria bacterium]